MKKIKSEDESIRTVTRTGGYTYYVTLPKKELEELKWSEGEEVTVRRRGRKLIVEKKK